MSAFRLDEATTADLEYDRCVTKPVRRADLIGAIEVETSLRARPTTESATGEPTGAAVLESAMAGSFLVIRLESYATFGEAELSVVGAQSGG